MAVKLHRCSGEWVKIKAGSSTSAPLVRSRGASALR